MCLYCFSEGWSYEQVGVDENDLRKLGEHWLVVDTEILWYGNADITLDGRVGLEDFAVVAENWLY